jgi:hypothetical protein
MPEALSKATVSETAANRGGPIRRFMAQEHAHLDSLLRHATLPADGAIDMDSYNDFRKGLLRHISLEEKILLPAIQRLRGGEPLPIAAQLRLEHGALASLLVPPPTDAILAAIRLVLERHNPLEEGAGGLYEIFDQMLEPAVEEVLAQLRAAPEVPVSANVGGPKVMAAAQRSLQRAGFPESLLDGT